MHHTRTGGGVGRRRTARIGSAAPDPLRDVAHGARSAPECEVVDLLQAAGLGPFVVNKDVHDPVGGWLGRCDVVWEALRAALEVDSREYHSDLPDWEQTLRRHNRPEQCGYVVLHVLPSDIRQRPGYVVHQVRQWLDRRTRDLSTSR